jgi:tripartite-type tricarboxylate transporter receptor subunit TctC
MTEIQLLSGVRGVRNSFGPLAMRRRVPAVVGGNKPQNLLRTLAIILVLALGGSTGVATASDISDFYAGRKITFIVGGEPGGSYDMYARLLSRHLAQKLPGSPTVLFQYMAGAGSVIAMNHVYGAAAQDGTVILAPNRTAAFAPILGQQGARYDPAKINWIGSLNNDVGVMQVWGAIPVKSIDDARGTQVIVGATSPLTDGYQYPKLLNNTLGTKFKLVVGYKSSPEVLNAFEAGEVRGVENSFLGMQERFPDWRNQLNILVQLSLKKHPSLPDTPLVFDLIKPEYVVPGRSVQEVEAMWRIILTQQAVGRPYAIGPGVPSERVSAMRNAFKAVLDERAFLADAEKSHLELQPLEGEEIQKMIDSVSSAPTPLVEKLRDLIR